MRILLATDGSECSERAAKFLTRFNFSSEDEIIVLHVISRVSFKDDRESYYAAVRQIKQEIAPRILDATVNVLSPVSAKISTAIVDGYADKSIIDVAVDADVDLIVMGARGLKSIKSFFLGSETRSVAINSPKSTLVVKSPRLEASGGMKILFATDGSDCADAAGRLLASMPFPDDTEITILNVAWSALADIPERFAMEVDSRIKDIVAKARTSEFIESEKLIEKAQKFLSGRFTKINGMTKVGNVSEEILSVAEKLNPDIIAVGSRGLRGIKGMLGSVSRNILGHSKCPVLIGKKG
jgi:nucleotide-binding universal stress UspA family protein